ncbi:ChaC-like protein [Delitschia confertaspora ATCC 74209]|uniref:glutathione-specific gamma-glutamylcyclotransferase n=1 Tax=Delitschia confertaspora ATCC 74209 TaxID=1513339 RepID=A0A9P4JY43_9PLEO|nr:ChaC-like protein [Delitschia confertaspora ATCC 74209]
MSSQTDAETLIERFGENDDFWIFGYGSLIWKPPPHYEGNPIDQRIPGYIQGYVRRFWQASEDHRGTPEAPGRVVTLIDRKHWETLTDHHEPTEKVWGAAYHIPSVHVAEVKNYLDIREINGYSIQFTPFHPAPFTTSISSPSSTPGPTNTNPLDGPPGGEDNKNSLAELATKTTKSRSRSRSEIHAMTSISSHPSPMTCLVYIGLPENPQFTGPQDPEELARHILRSRGPSGENKEYLYMLEKSLSELGRGSGDAHVSDLAQRAKEIEAREGVADAGQMGGVVEGGEYGGR